MRIKYKFEMMELDDHVVAVPVGEDASVFRGVIKLNETSADIFDLLKEETTEKSIVDALETQYDAPRSVLEADVKKCLDEFRERDILVG